MFHSKVIVNMNQRYIKRLSKIFPLVFVFISIACSDFLEKPVQGQLTEETFPTTAADALGATNAVYSILRNSSFHEGLFPILDIMSDDAHKGSNPTDAASTIGPYDTFKHINTEGSLASWWGALFRGVKLANVVIEKVPSIEMDESLKKRYIGEASFLRALFYFDLVRAWGGVPIVTTTQVSADLTRASVDDTYTLIINDLTIAIDGLPEKSEYESADLGRATKGAAKGLLSKVYLFKKDYVNAEKYALEVINSGQYSLESNFYNANSKAGEFGVESVFEIGAIAFEPGSDDPDSDKGGDQYGNVQGVRGTPNKGWGFNRPSLNLMAVFEPGDPRRDSTIIFIGGNTGEKQDVLDGVVIAGDGSTPDQTFDENNNLVQIECYSQKVWTPGNNVNSQFDHNRRILRLADVILIAAEASNENNKISQALFYLNQIRARARGSNGLILPDITETDQSKLRDIILKERRVELALESNRFWDLVRTGKAVEILGPLGFIPGKHELLAIPQSEIDLSNGSLEQNPQWK
jgi:hypothetical protein